MRAFVCGEVVDTEKYPWEIDGKSGTAYTVFVKPVGSRARDAAEGVKVSAEQFGATEVGSEVEWPCEIRLQLEGRRPKLTVRLDQDYDVKLGGSQPGPAALAAAS